MDIDLVVEAIVIIDIKYFLIPNFFFGPSVPCLARFTTCDEMEMSP